MSYKPGDKLVLEIERIEKIPGYGNICIGKHSVGAFVESSLHNLDRLDSDYINEHYGDLQDEAYAKGREDGFNDGKETGYFKGVNMAWDLARRLFLNACDGVENALSDRDLNEIFETRDVAYIVKRYTPEKIKSKIEAWEKAKEEIKVGDVVIVTSYEEPQALVVTCANEDDWCVLMNRQGKSTKVRRKALTKTGRTIDIASVLEQIGGAV